jgi:hypothetical protein
MCVCIRCSSKQLAEAKLIIDEYTGSKAPKQVNLKGHMISDIDVRPRDMGLLLKLNARTDIFLRKRFPRLNRTR